MMEKMNALVRAEDVSDDHAVRVVHKAAFPTDAESRLVDLLRSRGKAIVSLVAELNGKVIGHVLFSPWLRPVVNVGHAAFSS